MKETLEYLVKQIVDHPEDVTIEESNSESRVLLTIHAHSDDIGKIVGKQGRIIRSIRNLIKLIAAKHNTYVDVVLAE